MQGDNKNFKRQENKQFSITLTKDLTERIQHIRKVSNIKGYDAYKSLSSEILSWVKDQESLLKITANDHKHASICPECASKLRVCEGKKGKFIGCTNFPKCKYTASL